MKAKHRGLKVCSSLKTVLQWRCKTHTKKTSPVLGLSLKSIPFFSCIQQLEPRERYFACLLLLSLVWSRIVASAVSAKLPRLLRLCSPPPARPAGSQGVSRPAGRHSPNVFWVLRRGSFWWDKPENTSPGMRLGGMRSRCSSHLSWPLSTQRSSGSPSSSSGWLSSSPCPTQPPCRRNPFWPFVFAISFSWSRPKACDFRWGWEWRSISKSNLAPSSQPTREDYLFPV